MQGLNNLRRQVVVGVERVAEPEPLHPPARFPRGTLEMTPFGIEPHGEQDVERLLEDDVAEIVHDLKSPLSVIALEAVLLDDKIVRGDRSGGVRSLDRINANIAYLDRVIHDLLDVCSLVNGKLRLYREPTEIRDLLGQVIDRVVGTADRDRVYLDAAMPHTLVIDAHRIERVVANMLDNALKYTPAASGVVVRLSSFGGGVCVSVIDAGPGLSPQDVHTVFERYRRGETARGRTGTGLGLYVSKRIIEAHGGQIGVESIRGAGCRFFFELPAS